MNLGRPYHRSLFQKDHFDPSDFISVTRDISFHELNKLLGEHLDEVKGELASVVNDQFLSFVELFTEIGNSEDGAVDNLYDAVQAAFDRSKAIKVDLEEKVLSVDEVRTSLLLSYKEEITLKKQKELLENLAVLHDLCKNREISMAVIYFAQIRAELLNISDSLPSASYLSQKLNLIMEEIFQGLESHTITCLRSGDHESSLEAASLYFLLGKFNHFCRLFVDNITSPYFKKHINQARLQELCQMSTDKPGLVCLYEHLIEFVRHCKEVWLDPISVFANTCQSLYLDLLIQPLLNSILSDLNLIFSVGLPDAFQHSYISSQTFLSRLLSISPEETEKIRESEVWSKFQKGWQLNVYYQLRFREISSLLEESLQTQLHVIDFEGAIQLDVESIVQYKTFQDCLRKIWSDEFIIDSLLSKFIRLTLQTVARYVDWLVSIPSEFEGTSLGLSTCLFKYRLFIAVKNDLGNFYAENVLKKFEGSDAVLKELLSRFEKTKMADANNYFEELLLRFSLAFQLKQYEQIELTAKNPKSYFRTFKSIDSFLSSFSPIKGFLPRLFKESLPKIHDIFSSKWENSLKMVTNVKRLESVMKNELGADDKSKLTEHDLLKRFLQQEIGNIQSTTAEDELTDKLSVLLTRINTS